MRAITVLSGSAHYAPYWKLIRALREQGASVRVLAFDRTWNPGPRVAQDYEVLGELPIRRYTKRFGPLLRSVKPIRRAAVDAPVLYCLGFDMMLVARLAMLGMTKAPKVVYEVHDIRNVLVSAGPAGRIARWIDRQLTARADLLVVTSEAYLTHYFHGQVGADVRRSIVLENKLDPCHTPPPLLPRAHANGTLRIGYFGSLRCPESWSVLTRLPAANEGRIEVHVRGVPNTIPRLTADVKATRGMFYAGPYRNPDDLPEVYGAVDLVWAAGFNSKMCGGWSRTCRFYEACYFGKPVIAQKDSEDGRAVEALGIGLCVDVRRPDECIQQILHIDHAQIDRWHHRLKELPRDVFLYCDDHKRLLATIQGL
jgi:succinoglycan biosynthesis protein ExoL